MLMKFCDIIDNVIERTGKTVGWLIIPSAFLSPMT